MNLSVLQRAYLVPLRLRFKIPIRRDAAESPVLVYALSFLVPLIVRAIPELMTPVPIGFDTAVYLAQARELADKPVMTPFLAKVFGILYSWNIDLIAFMKVFPAIVYALTIFMATFYAYNKLGWKAKKTLVLTVVMSLSVAMLRTSWDLHRQAFATLLLLLYMNVNPAYDLSMKKMAYLALILSLIGLLHELVLAVATIINFSNTLAYARERRIRISMIFFVLALFPLLAYELAVLFSGGRAMGYWSLFFIDITENGRESHLSIVGHAISILVATFWYVLPLAPFGFFRDKYLTPWLAVMLFGYLTEIFVPFNAFRDPDRCMLYMAIPLLFYASNALHNVSQLLKKYGSISLALSLAVITSNGVSMLGLTSPVWIFPSSLYKEFIPSTMVWSTANPEHIAIVLTFADIINRDSGVNACVVTQDPWFQYWTRYKVGKDVYAFNGYDPEPAIANALEEGYERVYVIWFKGQVKDAEVIAEKSQLALYQIAPKT